jgi:hypothetical protein
MTEVVVRYPARRASRHTETLDVKVAGRWWLSLIYLGVANLRQFEGASETRGGWFERQAEISATRISQRQGDAGYGLEEYAGRDKGVWSGDIAWERGINNVVKCGRVTTAANLGECGVGCRFRG